MVWNLQISLDFSMNPPPRGVPKIRRELPQCDVRQDNLKEVLSQITPTKKKLKEEPVSYFEWCKKEGELLQSLDILDWDVLLNRRKIGLGIPALILLALMLYSGMLSILFFQASSICLGMGWANKHWSLWFCQYLEEDK